MIARAYVKQTARHAGRARAQEFTTYEGVLHEHSRAKSAATRYGYFLRRQPEYLSIGRAHARQHVIHCLRVCLGNSRSPCMLLVAPELRCVLCKYEKGYGRFADPQTLIQVGQS